MKTKKILFYSRPLSPPWDEASKNLAFDLAHSLADEFEFHILTTKTFSKKIKKTNIVSHPIFSSSQFNLTAKIKLLSWLYFNRLNFDIIHLPFTPRSLTSFLIRLRLKLFKGKVIQTIATLPLKELERYSNPLQNKTTFLKKLFFADKIITQSHYTEKKLEEFGLKNIQTIYPGIDLTLYQPKEKSTLLMEELGIETKDFVIQYTGEYTKIRGVDNVLKTFFLLCNKYPINSCPYKLVLALRIKNNQDKIKHQVLIEKVARLGYTGKVIFNADHQNRLSKKMGKYMNKLYNLANVNVFPVTEMTGKFDIPFAVIEAMACGSPLIISDLPILTEHIKDKENGLIVPAESTRQLAKAILYLKNNPVASDRIASNARRYVKENFDIKETAKKYARVYQQL